MTNPSIDMFREWQSHLVTKKLCERLEHLEAHIKEMQGNPAVIEAEGAIKHLMRMVGQRDIIEFILTLEFESIEEKEHEDTTDGL